MLTPKTLMLLAAVLFSIGTYGVLARRNLLVILMSLEVMLNAASLVLVAVARQFGDPGGHVFVLLVIAIAAAEVAVGLSVLISVFRHVRSTDPVDLEVLKG